LYFQDVRTNTGTVAKDSTEQATAPITVKGAKNSLVVGAAANILLNPLDDRSANSMRSAMGIGSIYISPFMEVAKAMGTKKGANLDRTNVGIAFTFESVR
jgi:hypothetical protein